jgi:hypothetical protein
MIQPFLRHLLPILVIAQMILAPVAVKAQATVDGKPDELLLTYELILNNDNGNLTPDDLDFFLEQVDKYFANPIHKKFLQTEAGKKVLALRDKLKIGKNSQTILKSCIEDKDLSNVYGLSLKAEIEKKQQCTPASSFNFSDTHKSVNNIISKVHKVSVTDVLDELSGHAYDNTVNTFIELKAIQGKGNDILTDGKIDANKFYDSAQWLFEQYPGFKSLGTPELADMQMAADKYVKINKVATRNVKLNPEKLLKEMRKNIQIYDEGGKSVPGAPIPIEQQLAYIGQDGYGYTPDMYEKYHSAQKWIEAERAQRTKQIDATNLVRDSYNEWSKDEMGEIIASASGLLLFTKPLDPYFKPRKTASEKYHKSNPNLPQGKAGEDLIHAAIQNALNETQKFGHFVANNASHINGFGQNVPESTLRDRLKNLIIASPAAVTQTLVSMPDSIGLICDIINEIAHDETTKKSQAYIWGGVIVGAAGILTLVSGPAGLAAMAAGTYWLMALEVVAGMAIAGGVIMSVNDFVSNHVIVNQIKSDMSMLHTSFIASGAKDFVAYNQLDASLSKLKQAIIQDYVLGGTVLLDFFFLSSALKLATVAEKIATMKRAVSFAKTFEESKELMPVLKTSLGKKGLQDLISLSTVHMTESPRAIFSAIAKLKGPQVSHLVEELSLLKKSKQSPEEIALAMKKLLHL